MQNYRLEQNNCGVVKISSDALYGATTQNTLNAFSISQHKIPIQLVHAIALIKYACAKANYELKKINKQKCDLICKSAMEICKGKLDKYFPLDLFQSGSCTPIHMNVNEVIANRSCQLADIPLGAKTFVHPNDDVNMGQSSNDVVPSAINICVATLIRDMLVPSLTEFKNVLLQHSKDWKDLKKVGRTHLRDAVTLTLGDEFSGYARLIEKAITRCNLCLLCLQEIPMGGTAVGNCVNSSEEFAKIVCNILRNETQLDLKISKNRFADQSCRDNYMEIAGHLKTISCCIFKIVNDFRLLGSGPICGLNEITIAPIHPGSSIMPGKNNPSMCEMMLSVVNYVQAMCQMVFNGVHIGELELNLNSNLDSYAMIESISILSNALHKFTENCVVSLKPNKEVLERNYKNALMDITTLIPSIGYDSACEAVDSVLAHKKTLKDILINKNER